MTASDITFRYNVECSLADQISGPEAPEEAHTFAGDLPEAAAAPALRLDPAPPFLSRVSGLYVRPRFGQPFFAGDDLRLDVDGSLPQMTASGVRRSGLAQQLHWMAKLSQVAQNVWQGGISYKDG